MSLLKNNPTETQAWQKLKKHFYEIQFVKMQELFAQNPNRIQEFNIRWNDFLIDFSKNRITAETIALLVELAEETGLKAGIDALVNGKIINETEGRKVLHTDLRKQTENQTTEVATTLKQMQYFCENRSEERRVGKERR